VWGPVRGRHSSPRYTCWPQRSARARARGPPGAPQSQSAARAAGAGRAAPRLFAPPRRRRHFFRAASFLFRDHARLLPTPAHTASPPGVAVRADRVREGSGVAGARRARAALSKGGMRVVRGPSRRLSLRPGQRGRVSAPHPGEPRRPAPPGQCGDERSVPAARRGGRIKHRLFTRGGRGEIRMRAPHARRTAGGRAAPTSPLLQLKPTQPNHTLEVGPSRGAVRHRRENRPERKNTRRCPTLRHLIF